MKSDVKEFLESGLLEAYVQGELTGADKLLAEGFIASNEEVRETYLQLQDSLRHIVGQVARPAPTGLREDILHEIKAQGKPSSSGDDGTGSRVIRRLAVAASVLALALGTVVIVQLRANAALRAEMASLQLRAQDLEAELAAQNTILASLNRTTEFLRDPATEKYVLQGNAQAPGFETIAYWNTERETALLNLNRLPALPQGQCYQMWADVDGEMLSLGVLPVDTSGVIDWNFLANAESLNVTIEPDGGSAHPDVSRLVASVGI